MQYLTSLLPLAVLAVANPLERRGWGCEDNACLAAVTGKAALGDDTIRASHCSSYLITTVTPPPVVITTTVTGSSAWADWKEKRATYAVCPNEVPNYASACDKDAYVSACSCYGYTSTGTITATAATTTKTVYEHGSGSCTGATATVTVTVTKGGPGSGSSSTKGANPTTTKDTTGPTPPAGGKCLKDADAEQIVANFKDLLEFTSYNGTQGRPGRGYHFNVSAATLAPDFIDISDSINFMAGFPLGSVTFPNKTAFDYGQGILQPEVTVTTLNVFHDCKSVTWRWSLSPFPGALPVTGINYMIINDKGLIQKNYAEFNNAAWLTNFGQTCAVNPVPPPVGPGAVKRSTPY